MSLLDISVRLDDLFERIDPVYGRSEMPGFEQIFEFQDFLEARLAGLGVGIPENDLERIFERFFKADRARSGGGTGLGLSISRHIVEAHGGRIWAESVEGKGSMFFFTIPIG